METPLSIKKDDVQTNLPSSHPEQIFLGKFILSSYFVHLVHVY